MTTSASATSASTAPRSRMSPCQIRRLQPPHRCRVKRPARHAVNTLDCGVAFERRYGRGPDLAGGPRDGHSQCHGLTVRRWARIAVPAPQVPGPSVEPQYLSPTERSQASRDSVTDGLGFEQDPPRHGALSDRPRRLARVEYGCAERILGGTREEPRLVLRSKTVCAWWMHGAWTISRPDICAARSTSDSTAASPKPAE
jgi:hypothetical protein